MHSEYKEIDKLKRERDRLRPRTGQVTKSTNETCLALARAIDERLEKLEDLFKSLQDIEELDQMLDTCG